MGPQQEDYIETVFTCEGDFDDPHLQDRIDDFQRGLKDLLLTDKNKLILKKVEPWNSVRVTFNIPREAAVRLKQLAQQGNTTLRDLGVLAVQILDQHISLTIAGRNNERTQLVFRTADPATTPPSVSMFNTNSPSLDELGPPGPGPSNVELTRKNIADYLRQGSSIIDNLLGQSGGDKLRPPGMGDDAHTYRPNNVLPMPAPGPGPPRMQQPVGHNSSYLSHSPTANSVSPNVNSAMSGGPKVPGQSGLPPGVPPHLLGAQGVGNGSFPSGLPPPPPYPTGSTYMNNLQKLRFGSSATSPLLVNLLQNDPSMASLLASGKFPGMEQAPPPPKKTRKPRKPREKKTKAATADGELPIKAVPNPVLSTPGTAQSSLPLMSQSMSTTHPTMSMLTNPQRKDGSHNPQAVHNMNVQSKADGVPLTNLGSMFRRPDDHDTAGKIINPVTGVLEPMELSDTSPAKSDGGKFSPEKLSPRSLGPRKSLAAGDIISGLISSHIRTENSVGNQGGPGTIHGVPGQLANPTVPSTVGLPHKSLDSSHMGFPNPGPSVQQKQYEEALRQKILLQASQSEKCEERTFPQSLGQQPTTHPRVSEQQGSELRPSVASSAASYTAPVLQKVPLPQESDLKSIPTQPLLNKPLLQVKHNSVGGKPSVSPDSNGDSQCSTQSLNLEPHTVAEPPSTNIETQIDPNIKSYSNDSGVGSSSERSDDTPSEPGDADYKSGHANSFDCAKTQITETLKHPPNPKVMTVGYAMTDNHMDLKNHKTFPPYLNPTALLNSKLDAHKLKKDKLDLHTFPTSQQASALNWVGKDQVVTKAVESHPNPPVRDAGNRKSPKLMASSPRPLSHGQQHPQLNAMQCNPEPTMHKKKSSPRGSPRNPSSPRSTSSPRNSNSPRMSDTSALSHSRQQFLTAQEFASQLPMYSESHVKLPGPVSSEQRMPPFSLPSAHRDAGNGAGVDTARLSPQCNIGEIVLLKQLEAAYAHTQLNQLTGVTGNNDIAILQKLEELRPLFQQLQQRSAQAQMLNSAMSNGTDDMKQPSKSPLSKSLEPHPSLAEVHNSFESVAFQNVHQTSAPTSSKISTELDSTAATYCVNSSRGSKVTSEEQKVNSVVTSSARRASPGASTTHSASFNPLMDSSLPLPKRLTESIQKLVKPLPFDNSLPHPNRRSPSSSASTTKTCTSSAVSPTRENSRGPVVSGSKTSGDPPHLDLDSITPSITGFNFEGPMDLHLENFHRLHNDMSVSGMVGLPTLSHTDTHLQQFSHHAGVSTAATRLVPAVSGSILSHKTFTSDSLANSAFPSTNSLPEGITHTNSVTIPGANTAVNTSQCNSDAKMANSALERTSTNTVVPGHYGPPILHPHNARYPLCKNSDRPKSLYPQMGLSEMLQETANLQSISTGRLSPHSQALSRSSPHVPTRQYSVSSELKGKTLVEKLEISIDNHLRSKSETPEPNVSPSSVPTCDLKSSLSDNFESSDSLSNSGTSIPPILEREICLNSASTNLSDSDSKCANAALEMAVTCVTRPQVQTTTSSVVSTARTVSEVSTVCTLQSNVEQSSASHSGGNGISSILTVSKDPSPQPDSANAVFPSTTVTVSISVSVESEPSSSNSGTSNSNLASNVTCLESKTSPTSTPTLENDLAHNLRAPKYNKKPPKLSGDESIEDSFSSDPDKPRQLRSRKRTNTGESDCSNSSDDPLCKRLKLDSHLEPTKIDLPKDTKIGSGVKSSATAVGSELKSVEDHNIADSVKGGLRARSNVKTEDGRDRSKPPGREVRKETRAVGGKVVPDKKVEQIKADEAKKNLRTRTPPSLPVDKSVARDRSPVRGSRTRGRNSPVVVDTAEDTQENKRTTRSARCKDPSAPVPPVPVGSDLASSNKRRRPSRDHR